MKSKKPKLSAAERMLYEWLTPISKKLTPSQIKLRIDIIRSIRKHYEK